MKRDKRAGKELLALAEAAVDWPFACARWNDKAGVPVCEGGQGGAARRVLGVCLIIETESLSPFTTAQCVACDHRETTNAAPNRGNLRLGDCDACASSSWAVAWARACADSAIQIAARITLQQAFRQHAQREECGVE